MAKNNTSNTGRIFIVEPTLITKIGHVSQCTYLFAQYSRDIGKEVIIFAPESAPSKLKIDENFVVIRCLPNTYESFLIEGAKFTYNLRILAKILTRFLGKKYQSKAMFLIDRSVWFMFFLSASKKTFSTLISEYGINSDDRIIFPNADHLTLRAILSSLLKMPIESRPTVGLRFINVMENNGIPKILRRNRLFRRIRQTGRAGLKIDVSAETEGYRALLSEYMQGTFVCEYPPEKNQNRKSQKKTQMEKGFVIGALGSARPDKGFTNLRTLAPRLLAAYGEKIQIITQEGLNPWGLEYDKTLAELRSYPKVSVLPSYLPFLEMQEAIDQCDILLMPYDEGTYEYRGSAMLFEAADRGIPMLVPSKTGLGEVIRKFGIGATFTSESDIIGSLNAILSTDSKVLKDRFAEYNLYRMQNFEKLITG